MRMKLRNLLSWESSHAVFLSWRPSVFENLGFHPYLNLHAPWWNRFTTCRSLSSDALTPDTIFDEPLCNHGNLLRPWTQKSGELQLCQMLAFSSTHFPIAVSNENIAYEPSSVRLRRKADSTWANLPWIQEKRWKLFI